MPVQIRNGASYICEYSRIIHIRRHFLENDIFGDDNRPLNPVLKTANTFNQSMSKFAELVAVIRGILKVSNAVKNEDLNRRRDDFVRDNLRMENNGAGIVVTDSKYDYTPLNDKTTPIPANQLEYIKTEIYDYLGVSKEIVENTATPQQEQAFYSGEIAPFFRKANAGVHERAVYRTGDRTRQPHHFFAANSVQFATLPEKVTAAKFLTEIGAATLDQILTMFDMPTIGGERRCAPRPDVEHGKRKTLPTSIRRAQTEKRRRMTRRRKKDPPPAEPDGGEARRLNVMGMKQGREYRAVQDFSLVPRAEEKG